MKLSTKLFGIMVLSSSLLSSSFAQQADQCTLDVQHNKNYVEIDGKRYYLGCLPEKSDEKLIEYLKQNSSDSMPDPKIEEVHIKLLLGETFSLVTPNDNSGNFCRWHFISDGIVLSDEEGIRRIEESGNICLHDVNMVDRSDILMHSSDCSCDSVNQLIAEFKAIAPGRVVFYVLNKSASKHKSEHGCSCKPTIKKFVIQVKIKNCWLPPALQH